MLHKVKLSLFAATAILLFAGCASIAQQTPFLSAEPEVGAVLTSAPRTLRLYYEQLPDVEKSTVILQDPAGNRVNLRGLHTMGANDLMMEINAPLSSGSYTVNWKTVLGDDPQEHEGSYTFSVQIN